MFQQMSNLYTVLNDTEQYQIESSFVHLVIYISEEFWVSTLTGSSSVDPNHEHVNK